MRYFFLLIILSYLGCQNAAPKTASDSLEESIVSEDEAVMALMNLLITSPKDSIETEHNLLVNHAIDSGYLVTLDDNRVLYQITTEGTGISPGYRDYIYINYRARLLNGRLVDSSYKKGKAFSGYLGNLVPGWMSLKHFKEGSTGRLLVPSRLAYGHEGIPNVIPPDSPIVFEVELLKVEKTPD